MYDPNLYEQVAHALEMLESARQQKAFKDATEGSKVTGDPATLELRAAAARQFFINDQKNKLAGRYFADALGARAFHDAMDGNIVTPDSIRAAEYVRQLRAANAAKADAEAKAGAAKAKADANAKAAAGNKNKPGKKPRMSDDEIDAFLKEELGGNTTGGTYTSSGVPKGGTKTIGYDPNPGGVSLAYTLRNEPEQVQRAALSAKWNLENGRSGSTYASPSVSTGGTYATGEGIKDANGNVLTNPGGDWEYQYALKNPQYGLGMMGKMSDAQKNYLQAVSDNMGYKYNFTGATRFV